MPDQNTYCPRCGRRRVANHSRSGDLCRDCYYVEPHWPNVIVQNEYAS